MLILVNNNRTECYHTNIDKHPIASMIEFISDIIPNVEILKIRSSRIDGHYYTIAWINERSTL